MKRYTPEELKTLEGCCQTFEDHITAYVNETDDPEKRRALFEKFNDDDVALHTQLCRMSHNELLIYAYSAAREAIRQQMLTIGYRRVADLAPGDEIPSVNSHWRIYEAVRARDFRTCKRILTEMIDKDAREI